MAKQRRPANAALPEEPETPSAAARQGRRRGRPLDPTRDSPILETTIHLLQEVGLDRFSMQEVAERAAVGLGTIYRRWPTKGDLIVAALKSAAADMNHEYTPDLDGLRDHLKDLAKLSIKQLDLLPGLVAAAHRDPEIAEALRASWLDPRLAAIRATVEVVPPTPLRPGLGELIAEVGPALLMMRALVTKEPLDDEVVDQILDDLVIPLLAFHGGAGDGPSAKDRQRSSAKSTRTRRSSQPGQGSSTRRRADRQGN